VYQNVASELRSRLDAVTRAAELAHRNAENQAAVLRQNAGKLEGDLQAVRARLVKALDDLQRVRMRFFSVLLNIYIFNAGCVW
jgi:multidrug resistance efflux pump